MDAELRILVFGNEESSVDLIEYELSKFSLPCTAVHVSSRDAFLQALQESSPDLILVTARGSGFGGLTALALAQEVCPGVPFFFVTAASPQEDGAGAQEGNMAAMFSPERLDGIMSGVGSLRLASRAAPRDREPADAAPSQKEFPVLFQIPGMVIAFVSPAGSILEFSQGAERLTGWRKHEVMGKDAIELFFPEAERTQAANYLNRVVSGAAPGTVDLHLRTRNGTERTCRWHCNPLSDSRGHLSGIIVVGQFTPEPQAGERPARMRLAKNGFPPPACRGTMTRRIGTC
jgi:PAS domain S-box-containing protein